MHASSDLTVDSPFLPASAGLTTAAVTEGGPIELHGILVMPDGARFSIFDSAKKSATWVRLNEHGTQYVVRSYSVVDGSDQVKIDYQGSTLTLGLKSPKIAAMTAQLPQGYSGQTGTQFNRSGSGGNAVTQSVMLNPTPADEAARLQAVVEAVAARRAARNQAVQQTVGAAVPQFMAPADAPRPSQRPVRRQQQ